MRFIPIVALVAFLLVFLCCIQRYYNFYYKRMIKYFSKDRITFNRKKRILINLLAVALTFCSLNVFSIIGIVLLHFVVICFVLEFVFWGIEKLKDLKLCRFLRVTMLPAMIISAAFIIYGYVHIRDVVMTEYDIKADNTGSYKVMLITDSHYGTIFQSEKLAKLKERMDSENVDFVILCGDIVDESTTNEQMHEVFEAFGSIKSKYGVYYVYGNHDRQNYSGNKTYTEDELNKTITDNNITILKNSFTYINDDLVLVGRDDYSVRTRPSVNELVNQIVDDRFILVADHQPQEYAEEAKNGVDLVVSGHTHGGQVFPAGYFTKLFKLADLVYGYAVIDDMDAIVSSGIAGWGYPIRTQADSEYVIININ